MDKPKETAGLEGRSELPCYTDKLWCDMKTIDQKIGFLESGRAHETGVIAKSLIPELVDILRTIKAKNMALRQSVDLYKRYELENWEVPAPKSYKDFMKNMLAALRA